jgi:hypothetical protein
VQQLGEQQQQLGEKQQQSQERVLELLQTTKEESCSISKISTNMWNGIVEHAHLSMKAIEIEIPASVRTKTIPEFQWSDESEGMQSDRYMAYLRQYISVTRRDLVWVNGDSHKNLLTAPASELLPCRLNGTCDAALIKSEYVRTGIPSCGLVVLFELKKEVGEGAKVQAMAELMAASSLSKDFQPVVVLTDLRDCWRIFYCDGSAICLSSLDGKRNVAAGLLEELIKRVKGPDLDGLTTELGEADSLGIFKRRKLATAKPLRGGEEAADVANLAELEPFLSATEYQRAVCMQVKARFLHQLPFLREQLIEGLGVGDKEAWCIDDTDGRAGIDRSHDVPRPWGMMYT